MCEMKKITLLVLTFCLATAAGGRAEADDEMSADSFNCFQSDINALAAHKHADAASAEIVVARTLIEDGTRRLRRGQRKKAAIIAERLPVQVNLIRILVSAEAAMKESEQLEAQASAIEKELRVIRERLARLTKKLRGTKHNADISRQSEVSR
jgi:hypothetical protein